MATVMIEHSDNHAATALSQTIGGTDGFDAAAKRLGLTRTHGGEGPLGGLTQTTAADQLTLLRAVFADGQDGSPLSASSRGYLQQLMGRIAADQNWGVSAADDGADIRLKNG